MDTNNNSPIPPVETPDDLHDRREIVRKLGRFAAYAAPFTVIAMTNKANGASGGGPHAQKPAASHH